MSRLRRGRITMSRSFGKMRWYVLYFLGIVDFTEEKGRIKGGWCPDPCRMCSSFVASERAYSKKVSTRR